MESLVHELRGRDSRGEEKEGNSMGVESCQVCVGGERRRGKEERDVEMEPMAWRWTGLTCVVSLTIS